MFKLSRILTLTIICISFHQVLSITEMYYRPHQTVWWRFSPPLLKTSEFITNMTTRLLRDMEQKLEQAEHIKSIYKDNPTYDLGSIVSGLQDSFRHMLEMYKIFANLKSFTTNTTFNLPMMLNGYHSMHGAYNQIRAEKVVYDNIMRNYLAKLAREKELLDNTGGPQGSIKQLKNLLANLKKELTRKPHAAGRLRTGMLESLTKHTPTKKLWEYKPKWFSENDRLPRY